MSPPAISTEFPFHKIMWSISSTISKLTHSWIFKKIYEFPPQESFNKGLCPVGAISWPDKHNNSTPWVEYFHPIQ